MPTRVENSQRLRQNIITLWDDGYTLSEISAELGWASPQSVAAYISRMRRQGENISYRKQPTPAGHLKQIESGRRVGSK